MTRIDTPPPMEDERMTHGCGLTDRELLGLGLFAAVSFLASIAAIACAANH